MLDAKPPSAIISSILFLFALTALLGLSACADKEAPPEAQTIRVSMLIQAADDDIRWFRDVEVPDGADGYELTEKVTEGNIEATYYASLRSHFVKSLLGIENQDPNYWIIWVWSETEEKWEPLPVGADLYSLKDGHVLAWAYTTDAFSDSKSPPSATP